MKAVIDTNSLLSLVRYYLPFDKKRVLFNFFKSKIEAGEVIIIDRVFDECIYISKGLVLSKLEYLKDKIFLKTAKLPYKTDNLIVPNVKQFLHQMNFVFVNSVMRKKLSDVEFENQKNLFLESADLKQVILCLNLKNGGENVVLVTEETERNNDNKLFKKIPAICRELEIDTMTLPNLLSNYEGIEIDFQ